MSLVTQALGISACVHASWRLQCSGKAERASQGLRRTLAKLCQETSGSWLRLLPAALLRIRVVHPRPPYSRALPGRQHPLTQRPQTEHCQSRSGARRLWCNMAPRCSQSQSLRTRKQPVSPGDPVLLKLGERDPRSDQLQLKPKGPYRVLPSTSTAGKFGGSYSRARESSQGHQRVTAYS